MALKRAAPSCAEGERPVKLSARQPAGDWAFGRPSTPEAKRQALPLFKGSVSYEAPARPSSSPSLPLFKGQAVLQRRSDLHEPVDDVFGELDEAKIGMQKPQPGDAGGELFNGMGREAYMMQHGHRKLHPQIATLTDLEINELGRLTFNEQFNLLEQNGIATRSGAPPPHRRHADLFGGAGREAFMQQHVHRKLHPKAAALGDQDLLALGKLSFNDQFPALEDSGVNGHAMAPDPFNGLGRDAFMAQRVHRKLHAHAAMLSDQQLRELGQLSFNQQFPFLESRQMAPAPQASVVDLFQGMGRDGFMQQRVHRKLHARAAPLSDEELSELGKLSFNDQFPALDQMAQFEQQAAAEHQQQQGTLVDFAGLSREAYMNTRIHRRLHGSAAQLTDQQLLELGQMSFNMQFTFLESIGEVVKQEPLLPDIFQGLGREGFMKQRVHRRLHAQAAGLSDEELLELGRRSFNDQFNTLEGLAVEAGGEQAFEQQLLPDPFGGIGREAYMAQRVHRRLHPQAARLSDQELLELGKLSFNQQFPALEGPMGGQAPAPAPQDLFQGHGREGYMQQRVHRRLHSKSMLLSDAELLELGRLSFNEQFPALEHIPG